ncbi:flagellar hook-associated protein FlgL [Siminovitchia sp. FSL H7-0308]|uniref:Flagellar hook-associated protein 3 FlgL n=1 Tax=Siminovitchia thermophila TaxID=1245522 RepID=A0ABS2R4V8_9BACI|nr:flagellar hook-associated protein FlgL [Siminovitchia thermophila]MBM7714189.1 flagellar hook-associated protein 3 FlgL [Siminovitchia thermophila]ONK23395.1 flagellar hook-associated protein FlgL [Bacillus sp. VT-16-64]
MRVTQSMLGHNSLRHLSNSYGRLNKIYDQINTGKKITRPSDDPVVAMRGITLRAHRNEIQQFKRNFAEAHNWIDNTDAALNQAGEAMHRINVLVNRAANETMEEDGKQAIADEIKQIKEQLINIANTKVGDRYIFSGTATNEPTVGGNINTEAVEIELGKGIKIPVNVTTEKVFSNDFFAKIDQVVEDIENGGDVQQHIGPMERLMNDLVTERTSLGARANRVDLMEERVGMQEIMARQLQSDNEDAEYEQLITEMVKEESLLRASLGVSARVIQPTLIDFLR